jgi:hypothetical protein
MNSSSSSSLSVKDETSSVASSTSSPGPSKGGKRGRKSTKGSSTAESGSDSESSNKKKNEEEMDDSMLGDAEVGQEQVQVQIQTKEDESNHRLNIIPLFYDQLTITDEYPSTSDLYGNHYRLPFYMKEEIENTPQNFKLISKNNYDLISSEKMPSLIIPDYGCECRNRGK